MTENKYSHPRIALIHATPLAMEPIAQAFAKHWPQAQCMHLLDDTLSKDRAKDGVLTNDMVDRFKELSTYSKQTGAQGILFTCSAISPASFWLLPSLRSYVTPFSFKTVSNALSIGLIFIFNVLLELSVIAVTVNVPVDALNDILLLETFNVVAAPLVAVKNVGYNVVVEESSLTVAPAAAQLNVPLALLTNAYPLTLASADGQVYVALPAAAAA